MLIVICIVKVADVDGGDGMCENEDGDDAEIPSGLTGLLMVINEDDSPYRMIEDDDTVTHLP